MTTIVFIDACSSCGGRTFDIKTVKDSVYDVLICKYCNAELAILDREMKPPPKFSDHDLIVASGIPFTGFPMRGFSSWVDGEVGESQLSVKQSSDD